MIEDGGGDDDVFGTWDYLKWWELGLYTSSSGDCELVG